MDYFPGISFHSNKRSALQHPNQLTRSTIVSSRVHAQPIEIALNIHKPAHIVTPNNNTNHPQSPQQHAQYQSTNQTNPSSLPTRPTSIHLMPLQANNKPNPLINQHRLRNLTSLRPQMRIIVLEHQLVDVDLADAARDTTLRDLVREPVGAVQHDAHAAGDLGADGFEAVGYWKLTKLLEEVSRRGKKSIKTATKMRSKTRQDRTRQVVFLTHRG